MRLALNSLVFVQDGFTPLAVAMQQGNDKVVTELLENDIRGKIRLPALHIAAKKDDCKAAALLLQVRVLCRIAAVCVPSTHTERWLRDFS